MFLAANKVDTERAEADAAELWSLGLGEPHTVSAMHGRGVADLLDTVIDALPTVSEMATGGGGPRRVALVGKPNVGKSSLLNRLAGDERSVVHDVAGTTVDPVDSLIEMDGRIWRFVDTAGLRRKVGQASGHEFYASVRTHGAIDAAEVAIVLIDASQPLTEQDQRVLSMVIEAGRALVLAFNKWDLVDEDRRYLLEREIDRELAQLEWAPRVNISAMTGRAVQKLVPALETSLESWDTRISTGQLNTFLKEVVAAHPPPVRGGKQPRILFATQATARPPTFVLFTTGFLGGRATGGSLSGGYARRSGSTAARSGSTSGCGKREARRLDRVGQVPVVAHDPDRAGRRRGRCDQRGRRLGHADHVPDSGHARLSAGDVDDVECGRPGRRQCVGHLGLSPRAARPVAPAALADPCVASWAQGSGAWLLLHLPEKVFTRSCRCCWSWR